MNTQTNMGAGMTIAGALALAGTALAGHAGQGGQSSPDIAFPYVATTPAWVSVADEDGGAFYDAAQGRYFAVLASDADASQDAVGRLRVPRRSTSSGGGTSTTQTSILTTEVDGQTVRVEIINGDIASVQRNGQAISPMEWTLDDGLLEVMNDDGDVIAVFSVDGIYTPGTIVEMPRGDVRYALPQTRSNRPMLGITYDSPDTVLAQQLGLGEGEGVVVLSTLDGLPAKIAGISAGDVIVGLDQSKPINEQSLVEMLSSKKPGERVMVELISRGERKTIDLELGSSSDERARVFFGRSTFVEEDEEQNARVRQELAEKNSRVRQELTETLRKLEIDEAQIQESMRGWEEAMRQAEAIVRENNVSRWIQPGQRGPAFTDEDNRFILRSFPTAPSVSATSPALDSDTAERLEDRMASLETQMDRLDRSIQRLIEAMER